METLWLEAKRCLQDMALHLIWKHVFLYHWGEQGEILQKRFAVYTSAFDWTCATLGNSKKQAVVLKHVFHFLSAGWHLKRCYLTPQDGREQLCLHSQVYVFPWKRAASGKDPLCSAPLLFPAPRSGRALQHPCLAGEAAASCSCPGQ